MKHKELIQNMITEINRVQNNQTITIMEVCGTHTHEIAKLGLHNLLSPNVRLISGPGCPVCVTPVQVIDHALSILKHEHTILVTFGDMMNVKGSHTTLNQERSNGHDVRIIYSPLDAIKIAKDNLDKTIVFLGIGFETTAPIIGTLVKQTKVNNIKNLFFLLSLKRMEPIIKKVLSSDHLAIDGLICPGHVATITGADYFQFIANSYQLPCVISGFEPLDLISSIYFLYKSIQSNKVQFKNLYKRSVKSNGNESALRLMKEIFTISDSEWRGLGNVKKSGLILSDDYKPYDALEHFNIQNNPLETEKSDCICHQIITGFKTPHECTLFKKTCTPHNPIGPCMVSGEGTCLSYYKYRKEAF